MRKAGRLSIRDLERATHSTRGPGDSAALWYEALDALEKRKLIIVEYDEEFGIRERFVKMP